MSKSSESGLVSDYINVRRGNVTTPVNETTTEEDNETEQISQFYKIQISDIMGRYLVAKSDIPAGTIILEEDPLVVGPSQGSSPLCIACYKPIQLSNCARNQNETAWTIISSMEAHEKYRRKTEMWNSDCTLINFIKNTTNLTQLTEDEIHSVCGYIQVNGFGVEGKEVTALFPSAFLLSHDCTPNTTHVIDSKFHLTIRTTVSIKKGDPLTISYCNTLQGTLWRREQLLGSKFFSCTCKRCSDNTEFNTFTSAVKCEKCQNGYLLPTNPLDDSSDWKCDICFNHKQKEIIYNFVNR
ncbi:unnamed protein product [Nezara viridula]|uniref:SET domain-containing protein n=1 Tax=Nezara viridula TaxID=85310 RepID=A0A9P0HED8_NEZVI|nr:unnamed protein product [Nezara viridula]